MKTTEMDEILKQKIAKIKRVYLFGIIFGIAALSFLALFYIQGETNSTFAILAAVFVSCYFASYTFFYGYQKGIRGKKGSDLWLLIFNMLFYCFTMTYSLGSFFPGQKSMNLLVIMFSVLYVPTIIGEYKAGKFKDKQK